MITHLFGKFRGARYRVVPAGRPRMTAQQPPRGQPAPLGRAMHRNGAQRVRRTAGVVATDVPVQRADQQPVRLQETNEQPLHVARRSARRPTALAQAASRSERNPASDVAERGSARTTTSVPVGVVGIRSAARCRSRRLTRFLTTALPIAFETTTPTRTRLCGTQSACRTKVGRVTRTPDRMVRWKSAERVIRAFLGSTGVVTGSGGKLFAALAPAGGHNGAACSCPHPKTKTMRTATTPVARLERALAHGKAPTIGW